MDFVNPLTNIIFANNKEEAEIEIIYTIMTVSQAVEKVVRVKPFVMEALTEGLLNISSLSRSINSDVAKLIGREVKQGAIVMALNRLAQRLNKAKIWNLNKMFSELGDIVVRSNLVDYTFRNSSSILDCHANLMDEISDRPENFYTMVRGVFESNLVVGASLCDLVENYFSKEDCKLIQRDLSAVTLALPSNNTTEVGFYYQIMKYIAWEGINVREVISTTNEFTIIVGEDDVDRAFATLKRLKVY